MVGRLYLLHDEDVEPWSHYAVKEEVRSFCEVSLLRFQILEGDPQGVSEMFRDSENLLYKVICVHIGQKGFWESHLSPSLFHCSLDPIFTGQACTNVS